MATTEKIAWSNARKELQGFVYRRVKDKALAEDIVQDVFLKVHSNLGQLRDSSKITGWIYQITRNAITDHFRNKARSLAPSDLDWESDKHAFNDCVAYCLGEMLLALPQKYREALELTEKENLSQTDLAERLHISYSGAKSRVQRARKLLKEKMNQQYLIKTDSYGNVIVCENRVPCHCPAPYTEGCD